MTDTDAALQRRIDILNDEKALVDAKNAQEIKIYQLLGKTAYATQLTRQKELDGMTEAQQASQRYIYALEDEATARDAATKSVQATITAVQGSIKTLSEYSSSLNTGAQAALTPEQRFAAQQTEFSNLLAAAQGPQTNEVERKAAADAAAKLPQVGNALLDTAKTLFASGEGYTNALSLVQTGVSDTITNLQGTESLAKTQLTEIQNQTGVLQSIDANSKTTAEYLTEYFKTATQSAAAKDAAVAGGSLAAAGAEPAVKIVLPPPPPPPVADPVATAAAERQRVELETQTALTRENNRLLQKQLEEAREATQATIRANAAAVAAQTAALEKAAQLETERAAWLASLPVQTESYGP
jgi:hypothetical protein